MTFSTCTHVRVAQDLPRTCCVNICTFFKSHFVSSCFNVLWSMSLTLPRSALPHRLHRQPHTCWREPGKPKSATPRRGLLFGPLAEYNALLGYEPNSWVEVSSEHTPIYYPSDEHGFYTGPYRHSRSLREPWRFSAASDSQPVASIVLNKCDNPLA